MRNESTVFTTMDLPEGTLIPFPSRPGERLRILYGRVWLTEEGKLDDAFLAEGEEVDLQGRGLAVLEALKPARIEWIRPAHQSLRTRITKVIQTVREWVGAERPAQCAAS